MFAVFTRVRFKMFGLVFADIVNCHCHIVEYMTRNNLEFVSIQCNFSSAVVFKLWPRTPKYDETFAAETSFLKYISIFCKKIKRNI